MFPCSAYGPGFWWIFPLLVIAIIVVIFIKMGRGICSRPDIRGPDSSLSALDILNKRYAHGEIGKEEYEEKKKAITERS